MENKKEVKITLKASDRAIEGSYSNNLMIHMNQQEFILDFINVIPPNATLSARIIATPGNMKRMLKTLDGVLAKYEKEFGDIPETAQVAPPDKIVQ